MTEQIKMTQGRTRRSNIWKAEASGCAEIGQEQVASFIASEILRDPDVRIALEGPWGSGKTRILSLINEELEKNSDIVIAWYDPWKYSPDETVLRRTLLDAIGRAVDRQCPECKTIIDKDRFHRDVDRVERKTEKDWKESIKESYLSFGSTLRGRLPFYLGFALLWTGLFILAGWVELKVPSLEQYLSIFVATLGGTILVAAVQDAFQAIQLVDVSPYVRMTLPKLDQIDLFESEYRSLMTCLSQKNKNLVVLVDDLDRCADQEIRTVMSGLTTYLEAPHSENSGRVSFIVAIDETKTVNSLQGAVESEPGRLNVMQKYFHYVIPVPAPTDLSLKHVIDSTLNELQWDVEESKRRRMAHMIAVYAGSNLRILKSTIMEAYTVKRYYEDVLEPQGVKVSDRLIDDPVLRFRVALIREITPAQSLRRFLSDPRVWLGKEDWTPSVPKDLFMMSPRFARDHLDPRPLLGLSPGMSLAAVAPSTAATIDALGQNEQQRLAGLISGLQAEAIVSLVSLVISSGIPEDPMEKLCSFVGGLVSMLHRAKSVLDKQDLDTFVTLVKHFKENANADQLSNIRYPEWVGVALCIGNKAVDEIFQAEFPLMQGAHRDKMLNELLSAADNDRIDGVLAYRIHVRILGGGSWEVLMPIATRLIKAGKLVRCRELHDLQIKCMEKWNYQQKPDGPPKELYAEDLVRSMDHDLHDKAANAYQIAANQQQENTRDFVASLPRQWPTHFHKESKE